MVKFVLDSVSVALITTPIDVLLLRMKTCTFMISIDIATRHCQVLACFLTLLTLVLHTKLEQTQRREKKWPEKGKRCLA